VVPLRPPKESSGYMNNRSLLAAHSTMFGQLFLPDASTDAVGS